MESAEKQQLLVGGRGPDGVVNHVFQAVHGCPEGVHSRGEGGVWPHLIHVGLNLAMGEEPIRSLGPRRPASVLAKAGDFAQQGLVQGRAQGFLMIQGLARSTERRFITAGLRSGCRAIWQGNFGLHFDRQNGYCRH